MRVLLIEDDRRVVGFLERGLKAERHIVQSVHDGEEGLARATEQEFDLIILDLLLPRMHGHDVCQALRQQRNFTPILMLSALDTLKDRVEGLRLGADDYLTKPFSFDELLARIDALQRRASNFSLQPKAIKFGPFVFDRETLEVLHDGAAIKLTAKELAVLELLLTPPGKIFSRERILSNVWGISEDPLTNIVDVYIGRLRKRLDQSDGPSLIQTVRGMGYRLDIRIAPPAPKP